MNGLIVLSGSFGFDGDLDAVVVCLSLCLVFSSIKKVVTVREREREREERKVTVNEIPHCIIKPALFRQ